MNEVPGQKPGLYDFLRGHLEIIPNSSQGDTLRKYSDIITGNDCFLWVGVVRSIDPFNIVRIRMNFLLNENSNPRKASSLWNSMLEKEARFVDSIDNIAFICRTTLPVETPIRDAGKLAVKMEEEKGMRDCRLLWNSASRPSMYRF